MHNYDLIIFVLVFVFGFKFAQVVQESVEQDVQKGSNLLVIWLFVFGKIHLFVAESFVYFCDLISIVIDFPQNILIQFKFFRFFPNFVLNVSFFFEQTSKEISKNVDASKDISEMPFHYVFAVFVLEGVHFRLHFLDVFAFQILLLHFRADLNFVVFV